LLVQNMIHFLLLKDFDELFSKILVTYNSVKIELCFSILFTRVFITEEEKS
jgi:hypothetical protein